MAEFDPFDFVPLFGPIQKMRDDQFAFKRAGRDLGDFSPLLAFGSVRGEGDRVILTLSRQQRALEGKVVRNARRLDTTERTVRAVRGDVRKLSVKLSSSRIARKQAIGGFRVTDEGSLKFGAVTMGRGGFTVDNGNLKNVSGVIWRASIATGVTAAAGNVLGDTANGVIDFSENARAALRSGQSLTRIYRDAARNAAGSSIQSALETFGISKLAKAAIRAGGATEAQADSQLADFFQRLTLSADQLREIKTNQKVAQETAAREVRERYEKMWEKISTTTPGTFVLRGKREAAMYRRDMQRINYRKFEDDRRRAVRAAREQALAASMGGV